ncbi:unnamed protein product, partial [marine sediment metagenome]
MRLIEELVKKGILTKEKADELEKEINSSNKKEEEVLLASKAIPEDSLFALKAEQLKIPLRDVADPKEISLEVLELIPAETAKFYSMVSLAKKENVLEVGMVYPEDLDAQEALK